MEPSLLMQEKQQLMALQQELARIRQQRRELLLGGRREATGSAPSLPPHPASPPSPMPHPVIPAETNPFFVVGAPSACSCSASVASALSPGEHSVSTSWWSEELGVGHHQHHYPYPIQRHPPPSSIPAQVPIHSSSSLRYGRHFLEDRLGHYPPAGRSGAQREPYRHPHQQPTSIYSSASSLFHAPYSFHNPQRQQPELYHHSPHGDDSSYQSYASYLHAQDPYRNDDSHLVGDETVVDQDCICSSCFPSPLENSGLLAHHSHLHPHHHGRHYHRAEQESLYFDTGGSSSDPSFLFPSPRSFSSASSPFSADSSPSDAIIPASNNIEEGLLCSLQQQQEPINDHKTEHKPQKALLINENNDTALSNQRQKRTRAGSKNNGRNLSYPSGEQQQRGPCLVTSHLQMVAIALDIMQVYRKFVWATSPLHPAALNEANVRYLLCTDEGLEERSSLAFNVNICLSIGAAMLGHMALGQDFYAKASEQLEHLLPSIPQSSSSPSSPSSPSSKPLGPPSKTPTPSKTSPPADYSIALGLTTFAFQTLAKSMDVEAFTRYLTEAMNICQRLGAWNSDVYVRCLHAISFHENTTQEDIKQLRSELERVRNLPYFPVTTTTASSSSKKIDKEKEDGDPNGDGLSAPYEMKRARRKDAEEKGAKVRGKPSVRAMMQEVLPVSIRNLRLINSASGVISNALGGIMLLKRRFKPQRQLSPQTRSLLQQMSEALESLELELKNEKQAFAHDPLPAATAMALKFVIWGLKAECARLANDEEAALRWAKRFLKKSQQDDFRFQVCGLEQVTQMVLTVFQQYSPDDLLPQQLNALAPLARVSPSMTAICHHFSSPPVSSSPSPSSILEESKSEVGGTEDALDENAFPSSEFVKQLMNLHNDIHLPVGLLDKQQLRGRRGRKGGTTMSMMTPQRQTKMKQKGIRRWFDDDEERDYHEQVNNSLDGETNEKESTARQARREWMTASASPSGAPPFSPPDQQQHQQYSSHSSFMFVQQQQQLLKWHSTNPPLPSSSSSASSPSSFSSSSSSSSSSSASSASSASSSSFAMTSTLMPSSEETSFGHERV